VIFFFFVRKASLFFTFVFLFLQFWRFFLRSFLAQAFSFRLSKWPLSHSTPPRTLYITPNVFLLQNVAHTRPTFPFLFSLCSLFFTRAFPSSPLYSGNPLPTFPHRFGDLAPPAFPRSYHVDASRPNKPSLCSGVPLPVPLL